VVLDEQHQQLKMKIHSPYRISEEYMSATESSRITARMKGILDAPPTFEMARLEVSTTQNTSTSTVTNIEGTRKRQSLVQ